MTHRMRAVLMTSTALPATALALAAHAQPAPNAQPLGGTVIGGAAVISQTAAGTQINQSSARAAINWKSFDVGSRQSVIFNQPSSSAVALNRVTGPDPSQIAGRIDANGQIILINQSGVNFYKGAQVNAAGLVVTTANMSNKNFMAGGALKFDQPGNANAGIDNQGSITIKQAGLAALVAPRVANSGTISARLGHVVLAGAKAATIDLYGDGLLSFDVSNQVTQVPKDAAGNKATALVTNTGVIAADGRTVQLTAAAADGIVQTLVQAGGKIRASTLGDHAGTIALNGIGGSILVEGQLAATGHAPGTRGGNIEVVSNGNVGVASTARINASGKAGGGTVAIGTTLARAQGAAPTTTARNVAVQQGASIVANAAGKGNGGRVAVLSGETTAMAGTINAKGGKTAGDGGFVEVSGGSLSLRGAVDVSAPHGATGMLLLDPDHLTIIHSNKASGSLDPTLNSSKQIGYGDDAGGSGTLTDFEINALKANIVLQAVNTITLAPGAPLTLGTGNSLTLQTQSGDITIGSPIRAKNIIMQAGTDAGSGGRLILNASLLTNLTNGSIALQADGGIALNARLSAATLDLSNISNGGIAEAKAGVIVAGSLQSGRGAGGNVAIDSINSIGTLAGFAVHGGGFSLVNDEANSLAVTGPVAAHDISIASRGLLMVTGGVSAADTVRLATLEPNAGIALNGGAVVTGSTISLAAGELGIRLNGNAVLGKSGAVIDLAATAGGVTEASSATIVAGTLQSPAGIVGTTALSGTANAIASVGSLAVAGGSFSLNNTGAMTIAGTLSADAIAIANGGALTVSGSARSDNTMTLTAGSIDIPGSVSGASVALSATFGSITQTGMLNAGTLSGNATGIALFTGAGNAIGTLGDFTATGFTLSDQGRLVAGGTVTADRVNLTADSIAIPGNITGGTVSLVARTGGLDETGIVAAGTLTGSAITDASVIGARNAIGTLGDFTAAGLTLNDGIALNVVGTVNASAVRLTANAISIPGTVNGATVSLTATAGAIDETGVLNTPVLTGSAVSSAFLVGRNNIATLNDFTASGFALEDAVGLNVTGAVSGGPSVAITAKGALDLGGTLTANAIGLIADTITETGALNAGTLTGGTIGSADLSGTNSIGTLNGFAAAGLNLVNGAGLTVTGAVAGGPSLAIAVSGPLAINGATSGGTVNLAAESITIPGSISGNSVALHGTIGGIEETGAIAAGSLTGSAATTADFSGTAFSNRIGTVSGFTAPTFNLVDGAALTVNGTVSGKTIGITATGDIDILGTLAASDSIGLASAGSIHEPGALLAVRLTGSAAGDASFTGTQPSNRVAHIGSFTAGGTLTLNDGTALTISGPLTAPSIVVDTGANTLTLADQAVITTGGTSRPGGSIASFPGDAPANTSNGAFLTTAGGFIQSGTSTILGIGGGPSVLRINTEGSANSTFDPVAGLQAEGTWLILDIGSGTTSGRINVKDLDVLHAGAGGEANLTGTVSGVAGFAAAGISGIQPISNAAFRINGCPIHSMTCELLSVPTASLSLPVTGNPLNDIYLGSLSGSNQDDDLLLPIVSDQDY